MSQDVKYSNGAPVKKYPPGSRVKYTGTITADLIGRSGVLVGEGKLSGTAMVHWDGYPSRPVHWTNLALETRTDPSAVYAGIVDTVRHLPQLGLKPAPEHTGKSVSYYKVEVKRPTTKDMPPYTAECNDIIEALGMNYAQGNAFKALWRQAAAIKLGLLKQGNNSLYDAEKVEFFGARLVEQFKGTK